MATLDRQGILSAARLGLRRVELPAGKGTIFVRGLSLRERDDLDRSAFAPGQPLGDIRVQLLLRALCDEGGARLFADGEADAVAALDAGILQPAFLAAAELSGVRESDVEDLAKNSAGGPGDGSPSGSPTASGA